MDLMKLIETYPMMKRVLYSGIQHLHTNSTTIQIKQKELEEN